MFSRQFVRTWCLIWLKTLYMGFRAELSRHAGRLEEPSDLCRTLNSRFEGKDLCDLAVSKDLYDLAVSKDFKGPTSFPFVIREIKFRKIL